MYSFLVGTKPVFGPFIILHNSLFENRNCVRNWGYYSCLPVVYRKKCIVRGLPVKDLFLYLIYIINILNHTFI